MKTIALLLAAGNGHLSVVHRHGDLGRVVGASDVHRHGLPDHVVQAALIQFAHIAEAGADEHERIGDPLLPLRVGDLGRTGGGAAELDRDVIGGHRHDRTAFQSDLRVDQEDEPASLSSRTAN